MPPTGAFTDLEWAQATLPIALSGLGLQSVLRIASFAFLASWTATANNVLTLHPPSSPIRAIFSDIITTLPLVSDLSGGVSPYTGPVLASQLPPTSPVHSPLHRLTAALHSAVSDVQHRLRAITSSSPPEDVQHIFRELKPFVAARPQDINLPFLVGHSKRLQHLCTLLDCISTLQTVYSSIGDNPAQMAQLRSQLQRGAGMFLSTVPTHRDLTLTNEQMRYSVCRWLLNMDVHKPDEGDSCPCSSKAKGKQKACDLHWESACNLGGHNILRHNMLVYVIKGFLRELGLHVSFGEPRAQGLLGANQKGGGDIEAFGLDLPIGTATVFDVSVVHPATKTGIAHGSHTTAFAAAVHKEKEKAAKYADYAKHGVVFQPLVFEATGAPGPQALAFLKRLASASRAMSDDEDGTSTIANWSLSTTLQQWLARISFCIHRMTAKMAIQGARNNIAHTEADFVVDHGSLIASMLNVEAIQKLLPTTRAAATASTA
jgi:hypothetical protein